MIISVQYSRPYIQYKVKFKIIYDSMKFWMDLKVSRLCHSIIGRDSPVFVSDQGHFRVWTRYKPGVYQLCLNTPIKDLL